MNKTVLITGASSGLGLSHAIYLRSKGYTIYGTSRNADGISLENLGKIYRQNHKKWKYTDKTKTKVQVKGSTIPKKIDKNLNQYLQEINFYTMDATSDTSVKNTVSSILEDIKAKNRDGLNIVINNAGIGFFGSIEELPLQAWRQTMETNFFGILRVIKTILPHMRKRNSGYIINTSSLGGEITIPFQAHYTVSKVAIKKLTEGMRMELRDTDIKISCLLPSDINTSFNKNTALISKEDTIELETYDINSLLNQTPEAKTSSYYSKAEKVWETIIKNLIVAPSPIVVSKKIHKIIRKKNPKLHYTAGCFSQRLFIFLIRRLLPDDLSYTLIPKYYGL